VVLARAQKTGGHLYQDSGTRAQVVTEPFVLDGNKRVAVTVMAAFLNVGGYELELTCGFENGELTAPTPLAQPMGRATYRGSLQEERCPVVVAQ